MRLSLELLIKKLLGNNKSLENQTSDLGKHLKKKGTPTSIRNFVFTVLERYTKYQNDHIMHDSHIRQEDVGLVVNLTSTLIAYLIHREEDIPI